LTIVKTPENVVVSNNPQTQPQAAQRSDADQASALPAIPSPTDPKDMRDVTTETDKPTSQAVKGVFDETVASVKIEATAEPTIKQEGEDQIHETATQEPRIQQKEVDMSNPDKQVTQSVNSSRIDSQEVLAAYHNLFLIIYSRPPVIDTEDISNALRQAELLIKIAELYGSVSTIRPYLNNCMMQYGRDVYTAILADPPRWLRLSLYLESAPIFKEAVIHIVGRYPFWPSSTVEVRSARLL
jgi:hypothetical protein